MSTSNGFNGSGAEISVSKFFLRKFSNKILFSYGIFDNENYFQNFMVIEQLLIVDILLIKQDQ